ncbi:sensor histidine kinase [Ligilactobacillus sp. WILCCON 0076]|uniref:histidine kinase n=1 Tax=Ligilactobacillus ubinensis TaxID=2876789 RepID=A0A9X2JKF1_9LACO|nr:sensor histidine kinase [Ligilactobacillus ubinensis]MCP0885735.1 sensor histidine kinase [Ligilactobacillus ubinensis]
MYSVSLEVTFDLLRFTWIPILLVVIRNTYRTYKEKQELLVARKQHLLPVNAPSKQVAYTYWQELQKIQEEEIILMRTKQLAADKRQDYLLLWSHELKLPLTALRLQAENNTKVDSVLILQELQLMQNQLEMLLGYERLDNFEHDLDFVWTALDKVLMPIIKEYSLFFIEKQLTPKIDVSRVTVLTDQKWLTFILKQLIFNAIKYANPHTDLTITWQQNKLIIQDYGIGISAAELPRVFEPGFTGSNGRQKQAATGMGLYLAQQVSQKLELKLMLLSKQGETTKASIEFREEQIR